MEQTTNPSRGVVIKTIYYYLVCFVALMMVVFSTADIINIALKTWVFTKADDNYYSGYMASCTIPIDPKLQDQTTTAAMKAECEKQQTLGVKQAQDNADAQRQRDVVRDISMIAVGIPLFLYHWRIVRKKDI